MSKQIVTGIVGAGAIANAHASQMNALPESYRIKGITDINLELAESRRAQCEIEQVYASSDEMINDPEIDAVILGVPNKYHMPLAVQAMEAGKDVILEKPMGMNQADALKIYKTQQATGRILMVPHQMRWNPMALKLQSLVEKGEMGDVYYAKTSWFRDAGIPGWGSWFTRKSESGGGPLVDIGVHMLDLTMFLMGNPKPVSVYGSTYSKFGPEKRGIGGWGTPNWDGYYDVEDLATALVKMEDGSTMALEVSWAVNIDKQSTSPALKLFGSEGGVSFANGDTATVSTYKFGTCLNQEISAKGENSRLAMFKHFAECVAKGEQPMSSAYTGLINNIILESIQKSAEIGDSVKIDLDAMLG